MKLKHRLVTSNYRLVISIKILFRQKIIDEDQGVDALRQTKFNILNCLLAISECKLNFVNTFIIHSFYAYFKVEHA